MRKKQCIAREVFYIQLGWFSFYLILILMQEEFSMHRKASKSSWNQRKPNNNGNGGVKSNAKEPVPVFQEHESTFRPRNRSYQRQRSQERRHVSHVQRGVYRGHREGRVLAGRQGPDGDGRRNLNHLLNFTFTPRHGMERNNRSYQKRTQHRPKFNKDRYLQANCQFVVQGNKEYSAHLHDPDLLVQWDLIEQILLHSNERPFCPICLEAPRSGRMTRCGHIYCWACVLQYMSKSSAVWSKCPICEQYISRTDLKSVLVLSHERPTVGEEITFTLMRRGRNDMIAVPVATYKEGITQSLPNMDRNHPLAPFSKLLVASDQEVLENIITCEKAELLAQLEEEEGESIAAFIQDALKEFEGRIENMNSVATLKEPYPTEELNSQMEQLSVGNNNEVPVVVYESAFDEILSTKSEQEQIVTPESEKRTPTFEPEKRTQSYVRSKQPKSTFYFYQASDGQMVFLHGLNIDMLVSANGSLDRCPLTLTGKVIELEETVMTENVRGKLRYLGHLSIGSTFQVAEIEMKSNPYVQEQTLLDFSESLNRRRRNRERRERYEEMREKRIAEEAKRNWPFYSQKAINKSDSCHPTQSIEGASAPLDAGNPVEADTSNMEAVDAPAMSFAQMLRDGKARPIRRVSNTEVQGASAEGRIESDTTDDNEDGWVPPPDYQQSFSNAVAADMKSITGYECGNSNEGRKKKKKQRKAQLLFSTLMARGKSN